MTIRAVAAVFLVTAAAALQIAADRSVQPTARPSLSDAVKARPFPEYRAWWPMGPTFSTFMADAIVGEWSALPGNDGGRAAVTSYAAEYVTTVYGQDMRPSLVDDFIAKQFSPPLQSGEFDALSYAFFRSAFEQISRQTGRDSSRLESERRQFTRRVGKRFFSRVHEHLGLRLPSHLDGPSNLALLKTAIADVIAFLTREKYFRDGAVFRFEVNVARKSGRLAQTEAGLLDRIKQNAEAYALFEMRYPVILPSAVYLFQTVGEAQHHSSRTIEELFERIGCVASETADFDPSDFPSELVVELWEIKARAKL